MAARAHARKAARKKGYRAQHFGIFQGAPRRRVSFLSRLQGILAHRRHKVIEKLDGPTDFKWVRDHPTYAPNTPKRTRWKTFRRLRKRLVTPSKQPELDDLKSLMGQLTRA
jgi:hypothetical protein